MTAMTQAERFGCQRGAIKASLSSERDEYGVVRFRFDAGIGRAP
jgi:hypothetical protein